MKELRIREFAKVCGCKTHTLRYYDDIGLLKPIYVDNISGYRYYTIEQVNDYHRIKELQEIGFTINEIKGLIHQDNHEIVIEIKQKIITLNKMIDRANELIKRYKK